jgi:hypothetical protein
MIRRRWLDKLEEFLSKPHTSKEIKECISNSVTTWLNDDQRIHHNDVPAEARMAYLSQSQLGWDHFIRGRLSLKWERTTKSHLQRNGISNITAKQWGSDFYTNQLGTYHQTMTSKKYLSPWIKQSRTNRKKKEKTCR